jgi:hypothetical protein
MSHSDAALENYFIIQSTLSNLGSIQPSFDFENIVSDASVVGFSGGLPITSVSLLHQVPASFQLVFLSSRFNFTLH